MIYENAAVWIDKKGFALSWDGKMSQETVDTENEADMDSLQKLADLNGQTVYLIREFIAVDADYQGHHPKKCARDWYVMKVEPSGVS